MNCRRSFPSDDYDILRPYFDGHATRRWSRRFIRDCQPVVMGNLTFEEVPPPHNSTVDIDDFDVAVVRHFSRTLDDGRTVFGHIIVVKSPSETLSVFEPRQPGGCEMHQRETVVETSRSSHCLVAANAGFYNVSDGGCLGSIDDLILSLVLVP